MEKEAETILNVKNVTNISDIMTTIAVSSETQLMLKKIGQKGETYDRIINRLHELAKRQLFYERQKRILETEEFVLLEEI